MKGLYIHIPFCNYICSYCDFTKSKPKNEEVMDLYIDLLISEIKTYEQYFSEIKTIYIGGGTPSLLSLHNLEKVFKTLKTIKPIEYSIEINPDTYTQEKGVLFKRYGINRVSVGVQTFDDDLIVSLKREHTKEEVLFAINSLNELEIANINLDLIYAIPSQTVKQVENDLKVIEGLKGKIKHVSYYSLILEENTFFYHQYMRDKIKLIDEDTELKMLSLVMEKLPQFGFNHYEISNYALSGYESKHNLLYWTNQEYIGCGLGASGFLKKQRIKNNHVHSKYKNKFINTIINEKLDDTLANEFIFGLRKIEGVNLDEINDKYAINTFERYPFINELIHEHLLEYDEFTKYLKLTKKGLTLGNQVFINFI